MHAADRISEALALRGQGLGARRISARTGIPISTIADWINGRVPRTIAKAACPDCGIVETVARDAGPDYVYLLGLYLGDGYIAPHARGVFRMRIKLDERYPDIVRFCETAMQKVAPRNRTSRVTDLGSWIEVGSYSKHWPCLFPQCGPGKKHTRKIELAPWQWELVERHPEQLLRGLIHSDGCRFINTGRGGWEGPRYVFNNKSEDILAIFRRACDLAGVGWTTAPRTVYVSRKSDVALLDTFIGPKT
jgi:hypothetical protein